MLACSLVTRTCLKTTRGLISGMFRRLTLEVLSPERNNCSPIWKLFKFLMTLLAGLFNKVAGIQDRHKSSVEFGPLVSMAYLFICCCFLNEIWPWHIGLRWAIVAFWATCWKRRITYAILIIKWRTYDAKCAFTLFCSRISRCFCLSNCG